MTMQMIYRMFSLGTIAWALLVVSTLAFAAKQKEAEATHVGRLVSITDDTLVMTNENGREYFHTLTADFTLTLDGKACKPADLKRGTRIRVTARGANKDMASRIEAIEKNSEFATYRQEGKVVSISGNTLVMTDTSGKEKLTRTLSADAKVTCDDKAGKPSDLKPGMRIRVTSASNNPFVAVQIEALDKHKEFASP